MDKRESNLYLVATPIGNIEDITLRAIRILNDVDVIASEDTSHSIKLLAHYGIKTRLISYYKQKEQRGSEQILALLAEGKKVALITDAGTPCISDPGAVVVKKAREAGFAVECIVGASAITAAAALIGLNEFSFVGFLGDKAKEKKTKITALAKSGMPIMLYSAPHDLDKDIALLYEILGDRELAVLAELTKLYQRVEFTTLKQGYEGLKQGEFVLVVMAGDADNSMLSLSIEEQLIQLHKLGISKKDAIKEVAAERNIPKSEVYKIAVNLDWN